MFTQEETQNPEVHTDESLQDGSKFKVGTIKAKRRKYGNTRHRWRMERLCSEENKSSVSERICLESKQVLSNASAGKTVNCRRCRSCGERRCCKSVCFLAFSSQELWCVLTQSHGMFQRWNHWSKKGKCGENLPVKWFYYKPKLSMSRWSFLLGRQKQSDLHRRRNIDSNWTEVSLFNGRLFVWTCFRFIFHTYSINVWRKHQVKCLLFLIILF